MSEYKLGDDLKLSPQERIRQLEQENARLCAELEQRRRMEGDLTESDARFQRTFAHAAIGYALTTPDGHFVSANASYCRLVGYSFEELQSIRFVDLIHPDDRAANMRLIDQELANEIPSFVIENRYVRKDGGLVWVRKSVSGILGPDGKPKWILALVEDITQHKQSEQALHASERIYRAIGEAIPYGVWICDPLGRNIYASQSYLDLVGITQEQCSEFGWGDTLHPDDAERTIAAWKECVRTEGIWDIEHRFKGTDGKYHPILARGIPVRDEHGKIICWAGINLDISGLKNVQEDLKRSEQRFQVALKNSPMLVYTTDRQLRYTWVFNPVFGFDTTQVVGKTDEELQNPEEVAELVALKRSVLETGIGRRQEIEMPHEGVNYSFDMTVEPLRDETGAITGLTVAAVDITENKQREKDALESQMRIELQRRILEQREQERLTLARDLHDGPLQALASVIIDLQMTRIALDAPPVQIELTRLEQNLRDVGQGLRDTVSELRDSMLRSMGLSRTIRVHARDFRKKHPEIELTCRLAADKTRLSTYASLSLFRIYQEALNNIVRHAGATKASVRLAFGGDCAILEVRDNGKGIQRIPDLLDQTAQGHYGLAGIKERAEAINGEYRLLSAPGKGTTLIVKIPLNKTAEEPRQKT